MNLYRLLLTIALSVIASAAYAEPQLGSRYEDFVKALGPPTELTKYNRTMTVRWSLPDTTTKPLSVQGATELIVSFFDHTACAAVVKLNRACASDDDIAIVSRWLPDFLAADFASPSYQGEHSRLFWLTSGGYVEIKILDGRCVIVVTGKLFLEQREIFNREAGRPTASH